MEAPYARGSETSEEAARRIEPDLGRLEALVLSAIRFASANGTIGMTCEGIEQAAGLRHQTASARIRGLVLRGYLEDSGYRRPTESGRSATVWRPTAAKMEQLSLGIA